MSARALKRAMERAHGDGLADGALSEARDPGRRGVEVGWTEYLEWAYDAGHREGRRRVEQCAADFAAKFGMTLEGAVEAMVPRK